MNLDEAIERLNALAAEAVKNDRPLRTTEELKAFFKNPPKRPRSIPMEEAMAAIIAAFRVADQDSRRAIASRLNKHAHRRFLGQAARMAVQAVRENSPDCIEQGLVALLLEEGGGDWRDSIVALFQLYHSAGKIGVDAARTFSKVADLGKPGLMTKEMVHFPLRPAGSRSLQAFCMEEEIGEDGFRYRQIPWKSPTPQPDRPVETPQQISLRLTPSQQQALIGLASSLAAMAIRTGSPKLVEQGLQGVAIGGGPLDPIHSRAALQKLHQAAVELGMDAAKVFEEASRLAPDGELKNEMARFPLG